jgi:hypothetical protein
MGYQHVREFTYSKTTGPESISDVSPGVANGMNLVVNFDRPLNQQDMIGVTAKMMTFYVYGRTTFTDQVLAKTVTYAYYWCNMHDPVLSAQTLSLAVCPEHNYTVVH